MRGCVYLCGGSCNSLSTPIPPGMHSRAHQRGQLNKFVGLGTLGALRTLWERGYRGQRIAGTFSIASMLPTAHQANGAPSQRLTLQRLTLQRALCRRERIPYARYPDTRCQMPDAKCQMPNAKCQMPDAKCQILQVTSSCSNRAGEAERFSCQLKGILGENCIFVFLRLKFYSRGEK